MEVSTGFVFIVRSSFSLEQGRRCAGGSGGEGRFRAFPHAAGGRSWPQRWEEGRIDGADTVTVTRQEVITSLHEPDRFVLAIVLVENGFAREPRYVRTIYAGTRVRGHRDSDEHQEPA